MEHFLLYAIGLSVVSFLSIVLTKPATDFPPYAIPTEALDTDLIPTESGLLSASRPPASLSEVVENAICHPYLNRPIQDTQLTHLDLEPIA
ncbi:MAG: hypothetical protein AAGG75_21380 [Bacteroidota bacterium]